MENNKQMNTRTILSSMEEVIDLAKKHSLEPEFHEKADTSLNYISDNLGLTKDEAMLLAFFFEKSSRNRIWISSIADMINVSNIRIISMMNIADDLIKKGYLTGKDNGKDEKYYSVPINVVNSIRQNLPVTPVKMSGLTVEEFYYRLSEVFDEEDLSHWERAEELKNLVKGNMCKGQHAPALLQDGGVVRSVPNRVSAPQCLCQQACQRG